MSKTEKRPQSRKMGPKEAAYTLMPWSCNHHPTYSEIEAYLPVTGEWEIIADIHDTKGVDAEVVAGLIARAVNAYDKGQSLLAEMAGALELCLDCSDCLSWEAEQESEAVLKKYRQR